MVRARLKCHVERRVARKLTGLLKCHYLRVRASGRERVPAPNYLAIPHHDGANCRVRRRAAEREPTQPERFSHVPGMLVRHNLYHRRCVRACHHYAVHVSCNKKPKVHQTFGV